MPHLDLKLDARWEASALPKAFDRCSILQSPNLLTRTTSFLHRRLLLTVYTLGQSFDRYSYFINSYLAASHAASLPTLSKWDQLLQPTACCTARASNHSCRWHLPAVQLHRQLLNIPEAHPQLNAAAQGWDCGMRTCHAGARLISSSIPIHIYPFLHLAAAAVKRGEQFPKD